MQQAGMSFGRGCAAGKARTCAVGGDVRWAGMRGEQGCAVGEAVRLARLMVGESRNCYISSTRQKKSGALTV